MEFLFENRTYQAQDSQKLQLTENERAKNERKHKIENAPF